MKSLEDVNRRLKARFDGFLGLFPQTNSTSFAGGYLGVQMAVIVQASSVGDRLWLEIYNDAFEQLRRIAEDDVKFGRNWAQQAKDFKPASKENPAFVVSGYVTTYTVTNVETFPVALPMLLVGMIFRNGLYMTQGVDYTLTNGKFTFKPGVLSNGDLIAVVTL